MKRFGLQWAVGLCLGLALMAPPAWSAPVDPATEVEVVAAEFGLFEERKGDLVFTPAEVVPHVLGQRYGWVIEVKTKKRSLNVTEEYVVPHPNQGSPTELEVARNLGLSNDKRIPVSQRILRPQDDHIYAEWSVGPNEPVGHRRLQVLIDDRVAARFEFDVK
ncbi:hypothetical protein AZSI13_02100 [Azospira sp. I13]|uniref:hypothetical protein n=1 Tax=Azospira sp. I13 TaxID=1765050 RepID=UPI000D476854|nr:hypothetical protein [Azospira sp. I13]GBG00883.1 hypothetical protein AZSI13_02100 [Azospira sp. I13]